LKAVGQHSALAHELEAARASDADRQSLEQSASSTSGTYFRAPRPEQEPAPLARGEPIIDGAKIEGLRFELDVGVWRMDSERIAQSIIADAEYVAVADGGTAEAGPGLACTQE
jgi:anti-sigma28 factor (negative regulator of flagellin synthesis)